MKKIKNPFERFLAPDTQIVKHGKWFSIAPLAIIAIGILVVIIFNFNLGLDFTGGQIIQIGGINRAQEDDIRAVVREVLVDELGRAAANRAFFQLEESERGGFSVTVRYQEPSGTPDEVHNTNVRIRQSIGRELSARTIVFDDPIEPSSSLSASASADRLMNVFIAVFAALIGILLYMLFRFKFTSGVAAIIGLFHDVLIMLSMVAIFQIQINFVFVAAVITVVAYSLNNSIVLLDRVRDKERDVSNTGSVAQKVDSSIRKPFGGLRLPRSLHLCRLLSLHCSEFRHSESLRCRLSLDFSPEHTQRFV